MIDFLKGKKTYLIAAGTVVYAGLGLLLGHMDQATATAMILGALGLAAVRDGIKTELRK